MTRHVALLGDSVFDNGSYTRGEPDVAAHLRAVLDGARVTLLAVDGATTVDVGPQLDRVPRDAHALVLSLGGNDALSHADLLDFPVRSTGEALDLLGEAVDAFEQRYRHVLEALARFERRLVVCTVYDGNLAGREAARARVALMLFDDVIVRTAARFGADVLDLRAVCTSPEDYANPIEPSGTGGAKIARALADVLADGPATRLFGRRT